MKSGCAPSGEQPQTLHPPTLGVWGGRGGEGESVRIAEGQGQGESRHPDPTPRPPDTQRVMEGMKTECERNAKGKKSRNASGMRGECNRKSKGAGGRGEGSKGQGGATEPKAQKSLGAKNHATT